MKSAPDLYLEEDLYLSGSSVIVGLDEVGRGAWAGPVSIGAVVTRRAVLLEGVNDSKLLTPAKRKTLRPAILEWALAGAVGSATHEEVDRLGMSKALRLAAIRALKDIVGQGVVPDTILLDGNFDFLSKPLEDPQLKVPLEAAVHTVIKGDTKSLSMAAASILAKTQRDAYMEEQALTYEHWDFAQNKGYHSKKHVAGLTKHGVSPIHRLSWSYMDKLGLR